MRAGTHPEVALTDRWRQCLTGSITIFNCHVIMGPKHQWYITVRARTGAALWFLGIGLSGLVFYRLFKELYLYYRYSVNWNIFENRLEEDNPVTDESLVTDNSNFPSSSSTLPPAKSSLYTHKDSSRQVCQSSVDNPLSSSSFSEVFSRLNQALLHSSFVRNSFRNHSSSISSDFVVDDVFSESPNPSTLYSHITTSSQTSLSTHFAAFIESNIELEGSDAGKEHKNTAKEFQIGSNRNETSQSFISCVSDEDQLKKPVDSLILKDQTISDFGSEELLSINKRHKHRRRSTDTLRRLSRIARKYHLKSLKQCDSTNEDWLDNCCLQKASPFTQTSLIRNGENEIEEANGLVVVSDSISSVLSSTSSSIIHEQVYQDASDLWASPNTMFWQRDSHRFCKSLTNSPRISSPSSRKFMKEFPGPQNRRASTDSTPSSVFSECQQMYEHLDHELRHVQNELLDLKVTCSDLNASSTRVLSQADHLDVQLARFYQDVVDMRQNLLPHSRYSQTEEAELYSVLDQLEKKDPGIEETGVDLAFIEQNFPELFIGLKEANLIKG